MADAIVVFCTTNSQDEANQIAKSLVNDHLAACVNIIPNITSIYRWEGELCTDYEFILIIKSLQQNLDRLVEKIRELHSYKVPEILAVPVIGGSQDYLNWLVAETAQG